ncbi:MAG: tetratricopeptide repeat protein [Candidatus Aminicenantes bacterium]|nr:tetratricopeptide repeat protein [Candidatus Aminicenantes bacterium]
MKKFIGRVKQLGDFKKSIFCMLDNRGHSPFPRLFLFSGEGGLGKSMLLDECIKTAEETVKEKGRKITVIKLDWDDYYYKNSPLPDDDTKMIKGLYTAFCEKVEKPEKYFKDYTKKLEEVDKVNQKVAKERKDFVPESKIITEGLKFLATANGIPVPGKAGDVFQEGLNAALTFAYEHELKFREWLRKQGTLPEKDLTLYENANHDLSIALVKGLSALSKDSPVLLAVDTYERVDREKIEEWFRTLFLKKLLDAAPRMGVILSGRNNHYKAYRDQFPGESLYHVSLDEILFNTEEINEFTRAFDLEIKESDIKKLEQCTLGIPMVVEEVCYRLQEGKPLGDVLASFESRSEQIKDIIEGVVDRFLKHCDNETREWVFHLAMLRQFDDKLLSAIWGLPVKEVNGILSTMAERHSFIQGRRMHGKVREFIRVHLVNEIVSNRNSHIFEEFGKNTLASLGARLDEIEKEEEPLEDLFTGETFQAAFLDYINALMWTDRERAFLSTRKHFLELLEFNPPVLFGVFHFMDELKPCLSAKQKKVFNILFTGFLQNLFTGNFGNVYGEEELELFTFLEDNKKSLTDFQRRLLAYKWADFYSRSGKLDEAMTFLNKIPGLTTVSAKIKEKIIKTYSSLGGQYALKKSYAQSLKCCNKAIELNPEYAAAYINRGNVYYGQHDYVNALSDYTKAIELKPDDTLAYYNRGICYNAQKNYDKALSDYTMAIELNPGYAKAYNNRGNTYNELKDYDKALFDFNRAIELKPEYADAYNNRGNTHYYQKEYEKALSNYNKAIELNPNHTNAYNNRGNVYNIQNDYNKALSDYDKAIELNPNYADAYNNRGNVYNTQNEYDKALSDYDKAIKLKPEYATAFNNRGGLHYAQKSYDKAISDFTKAIELNPESAEAYNNRGNTFNAQKDYDIALPDLNRAIELNPEYAEAYNNRGNNYYAQKDYKKAIFDFNRAIDLNPEYANPYLNLAELYIITNDFLKALETLHKASSLSLEVNDRAIMLYLENIAKKMTDADTMDCEKQFNQVLNEDFTITWSFDDLKAWLQSTPISEEKNAFINEKTDALKKHKV